MKLRLYGVRDAVDSVSMLTLAAIIRRDARTAADVARHTGLGRSQAQRALARMKKDGVLREGQYGGVEPNRRLATWPETEAFVLAATSARIVVGRCLLRNWRHPREMARLLRKVLA